MSLRQVEGVSGAPWERPLAGALDRLVVESDLLADNPLGDPARLPPSTRSISSTASTGD
jgi:hypothetical protein